MENYEKGVLNSSLIEGIFTCIFIIDNLLRKDKHFSKKNNKGIHKEIKLNAKGHWTAQEESLFLKAIILRYMKLFQQELVLRLDHMPKNFQKNLIKKL